MTSPHGRGMMGKGNQAVAPVFGEAGEPALMEFIHAVCAEAKAHGVTLDVGITSSFIEFRIENPRFEGYDKLAFERAALKQKGVYNTEDFEGCWGRLRVILFGFFGEDHQITCWPHIEAFLERHKAGGYTGRDGGPVGDDLERVKANIIARVDSMPRDNLPALAKLIDDFARTNGEVAASQPATATPRPDWIEARKQPGKVADLLAQFIQAKFADELDDRTMSTHKLYRYKSLYQAFYDHRSELPPDLQSIPTKSAGNDRQVAEGKVKPVRPRLPRTDQQRAFDRGVRQQQRARHRGIAAPP